MDSYQNEQKRLAKTSDLNMQYKDRCEEKARELRWRDNNNARPYQFPGIEGMKEYLKHTGAARFREE
jgi:hypothetical protein